MAVPGCKIFVGGRIGEDAHLALEPTYTGIPLEDDELIPLLVKILKEEFKGVDRVPVDASAASVATADVDVTPAPAVIEKEEAPAPAPVAVVKKEEVKEEAAPKPVPAPAPVAKKEEKKASPVPVPVPVPVPEPVQIRLDHKEQPLSPADEEKEAAKYAAIDDIGERLFLILQDLEMFERT